MGAFINPFTDWGFKLDAVYGVFFINFPLDREDGGYFCKDVALVENRTSPLPERRSRM